MNKDLAEYVATISFKSASEFGRLLPILKENLPESEYEPLRKAIAKISADIGAEILLKIFKEHPDIDAHIKKTIEQYGKIP